MKEYSKEEKNDILKSLQTIRQVCFDTKDCATCPLGNENGDCMLSSDRGYPINWSIGIEPPKIWRALT